MPKNERFAILHSPLKDAFNTQVTCNFCLKRSYDPDYIDQSYFTEEVNLCTINTSHLYGFLLQDT